MATHNRSPGDVCASCGLTWRQHQERRPRHIFEDAERSHDDPIHWARSQLGFIDEFDPGREESGSIPTAELRLLVKAFDARAESEELRKKAEADFAAYRMLHESDVAGAWTWSGDGTDDLDSMGGTMVIRIWAQSLRGLLADAYAKGKDAAEMGNSHGE